MRSLLGVFLVLLGSACFLGGGAVAWGQGAGFVCYSPQYVCGPYDCAGIVSSSCGLETTCIQSNAGVGGGCIAATGNCALVNNTCRRRYILDSGLCCDGTVKCYFDTAITYCVIPGYTPPGPPPA
jgi:hypothetical protein